MTSTQIQTQTAVRHFIAFAADESFPSAIYGIGHTADAATEDAYEGSQTRPAGMTWDDDAREWSVTCPNSGDVTTFTDEDRAREHAASLGFKAEECTDRLYERVQADGCAAGNPGYEWTRLPSGLFDLVEEAKPIEAPARYFIATWSSPKADVTIQGMGRTADAAIADAMKSAGIEKSSAFRALEGTERFYRAAETGGVTSWTTNAAGLEDLDVDADDLAAALAEVEAGLLEGDNGFDAWKAEDAEDDAREYVDAYIVQDETSEYHRQVSKDYEFRFALELAVRDLVLGMIAQRDAA